MRQITGLFLAILLLLAHTASALTNSSATLTWKATSPGVRMEVRWQNWLSPTWAVVSTDIDGALGQYVHSFTAMPDSTGDRWACWDARFKWNDPVKGWQYNPWDSEVTSPTCNQIPLSAAPTPTPVPLPTPSPAPTGLVISSATPLEVVITASSADCPHITTSTKGSTATKPRRTIICVK